MLKQSQPSAHPVAGLHERVAAGRRPAVLLSRELLQFGRRLTPNTVQLHRLHHADTAGDTAVPGAIGPSKHGKIQNCLTLRHSGDPDQLTEGSRE